MPHSHEINLLARYGYFAQAEIERVLLGPRAEFSLTLRPMLLSGQGKSLVLRVGGVSPFPEVEATLNDWIGYTLEGVHPQEGAGVDLQLTMAHTEGEMVIFCKNLGVIDPYEQYD